MKTELINKINEFKKREEKLKRALIKVRDMLNGYKYKAPEGDIWNLTHDLEYRLECRLKEVYSDYYSWHWETFGYNIY